LILLYDHKSHVKKSRLIACFFILLNKPLFIKAIIINHYCPVKMSLPGLKPNTGVGFINPSLKAGVIRLKPLSIGL